MLANNICAYVDTSLVGQMKTWFLNNKSIKDYTGQVHSEGDGTSAGTPENP
jgi:hypothetical protein